MKKVFVVLIIMLSLVLSGCENNNKKINNNQQSKTDDIEKINDNQAIRKGLGPHPLNKERIADVEITDELKLSDISLIIEENKSTFVAYLTNTSNKDIKLSEISVIIRDHKDQEMTTLRLFIGEIKSNEVKKYDAFVNSKLEEYSTYELKLIE